MSTVTQRIPNLYLGVSQQPDSRKFPGQVRNATNVYPEYALGLLKRAGSKYSSNLYNATSSGKWFSILRDDVEKYVGQYDNNCFRVWSLIDGSPRTVNMGTNTGVPVACNYTNVQTRLLDLNTARATLNTAINTLHTKQAVYAKTLAGQVGLESTLFEVDFSYPYADIVETVVSGILLNESGVYVVKNNNAVISSNTSLPASYALGNDRTDEHPSIGKNGFKLYEAVYTAAPAYTAGQLATALSEMNTAQSAVTTASSDELTKRGLYDTEINNCAITSVPSNAYLKDAAASDIEFLTLNDYTFVLNKAKTVAMKATVKPALPHQAFFVIAVVAYNTKYQVVLGGTTYSITTPANVGAGIADSETIVSGLVSAINAGGIYTATASGPGFYVTRGSAFTVLTTGGSQDSGLYGFQDQVSNVTRLPAQCKNGYIVKIANSDDVDVDDMWVEFKTTNSAAYGPGVWEETTAPGITYQLDELTMPHQLVRQSNGTFSYSPVTWIERLVGDNTTNPIPTFVGKTINNVFFYRNRLGFLSEDTVILSKAGDYFNFFGTSAQVATDDDPIDISVSTINPVILKYVRAISVGLLLFSNKEQFLLSTDSDILSPKTAKINTLATYEADENTQAVGLGTSVGFLSKTALYTKMFEMFAINKDDPPFLIDQTQIVPEYIPSTVDTFIASPSLSLVSIGTKGSDTLYQYRFLQQGEKRIAQTWYNWQLTGSLVLQFFDNSIFYVVTSYGGQVYTSSMNLTQASEEGFLTLPTGERTDVSLDMWKVNPYRTYNSSTLTSRIFLPYNDLNTATLCVVALGGYIGDPIQVGNASSGSVLYPTVAGTPGNYYFDLDGDYRGLNIIIGYIYDMEVELPKFYVVNASQESATADEHADLIIHRMKVSTGLSGPITYQVDITGIPTFNNVVNTTFPNQYLNNNVALQSDSVHNVPLYQRNTNLSIKIIGDSPFPVSILSLNWEGKFNNGFYRRAS